MEELQSLTTYEWAMLAAWIGVIAYMAVDHFGGR